MNLNDSMKHGEQKISSRIVYDEWIEKCASDSYNYYKNIVLEKASSLALKPITFLNNFSIYHRNKQITMWDYGMTCNEIRTIAETDPSNVCKDYGNQLNKLFHERKDFNGNYNIVGNFNKRHIYHPDGSHTESSCNIYLKISKS